MSCLFCRGAQTLVVALRLSCFLACGILVPSPGIKPMSPAWQGGFLTAGPPGKSLEQTFKERDEAGAHLACSRSSKEACVARSERVSGSQMLGMPGGIFHRHNLGWEVWGCCWRPVNRCQVAVKHPAGHRQLPTTKICVGIPVMPRSRNPEEWDEVGEERAREVTANPVFVLFCLS